MFRWRLLPPLVANLAACVWVIACLALSALIGAKTWARRWHWERRMFRDVHISPSVGEWLRKKHQGQDDDSKSASITAIKQIVPASKAVRTAL